MARKRQEILGQTEFIPSPLGSGPTTEREPEQIHVPPLFLSKKWPNLDLAAEQTKWKEPGVPSNQQERLLSDAHQRMIADLDDAALRGWQGIQEYMETLKISFREVWPDRNEHEILENPLPGPDVSREIANHFFRRSLGAKITEELERSSQNRNRSI